MTTLTIHNLETAPGGSKESLQQSLKAFGMLPNLHGVMAGAPAVLEAYKKLHELFMETSFNAEELTVVWQSINVEHDCGYCVPAHTGIAHSMKVDAQIIEALRNETPLADEKLQALRTFTLAVVRLRGHVQQEDLDSFYAAGYTEQQVLEIILGLAQKVMSNYTNHIASTPVDAPFQQFEWKKSG